ncbi:hypothetical protein BGZ96_008438 [Linnemannia gamsii]|uniref:F-box domain-containing protein n=1 Tax=Linnemannia gamsii TaxID=64522 RepID=A0ABQ7K0I1_9FUNG|nr:hypothetical protein BGZ96_008438 [Linnemannia gamsii]
MPSQDEYHQIYSRDSEIYANCIYDSEDHTYSELEDDYDDDYNICFVPSLPHKYNPKRNIAPFKPNFLLRKRVETKVIQPLLDSPVLPELPPEVFELICTHLNQTTLRRSVNRVCKSWHEISNRFLNRTGIWKPVEGACELILQQLPLISTLELWFNKDPEFPTITIRIEDQTKEWNQFVCAITGSTPSNGDAQTDNTNADGNNSHSINSSVNAPSNLLRTIRHMKLQGYELNYSDTLSSLRGHLQFIETLTIMTAYRVFPIPLFAILADFPALKSFNVTLPAGVSGDVIHGDEQDIDDEPLPVDGPPKMYPEQYRLQRFSVSGASTTLRVLKRLIVTCPDLRLFNLESILITMSNVEEDHSEEGQAIQEVEEHIATQALIDLAAKHCPDLESYSFHRRDHGTDEIQLGNVARAFPDQWSYSMIFPNDTFDTLAIRDLLSKLTVLKIQTSRYSVNSDVLNRVLCLAPNLVHLDGLKADFSTSSLWKPPAPAEPKRIFATAGDRKRYERKEQRRARAQHQAYTRHGSRASAAANDTPAIDPSTPVTWSFYKLKTLKLNLIQGDSTVDFTDYISRNRLFRNLVTFNLLIPSLEVGQQKTFDDMPRSRYRSKDDPPLEPTRFPNELLALRGLQCLEECILRTFSVPGMVVTKNFWFMRRKIDSHTVSFLTAKRKRMSRKMKRRRRMDNKSSLKMNTTAGGDNLDEDDDDEEEATSSKSKRLFSKAGLLLSARKSSLSFSNFCNMLMHNSYEKFKEFYIAA